MLARHALQVARGRPACERGSLRRTVREAVGASDFTRLPAARPRRWAHSLTEVADAADVAGALGDGDRAAGVHQVEEVAGLEDHVVGGQHQDLPW